MPLPLLKRTDELGTSPICTPDDILTSVQGAAVADHAAITAYTAADISASYVEAEVQAIADALETAVGELTTLRAKVNEVIASLETSKVIAS